MARASSKAWTSMSRAWAFRASAFSGVAYFNRSSAFTISSKISFASIASPSDPADLHDRLHVPVTPLERLHPCDQRHPSRHPPPPPRPPPPATPPPRLPPCGQRHPSGHQPVQPSAPEFGVGGLTVTANIVI